MWGTSITFVGIRPFPSSLKNGNRHLRELVGQQIQKCVGFFFARSALRVSLKKEIGYRCRNPGVFENAAVGRIFRAGHNCSRGIHGETRIAGTRTPRRSKLNGSPVPVSAAWPRIRPACKPEEERDRRCRRARRKRPTRPYCPKGWIGADRVIHVRNESLALPHVVIGMLIGGENFAAAGPG